MIEIFDNKGRLRRIISIPEHEEIPIPDMTQRITHDMFDCTFIDTDD